MRTVLTFSLTDGSSVTAVELQWEFFRLAQKYADEVGLDTCGDDAQMADLMRRWEQVLTAVEEVENALAAQSRQARRVEALQASVESNRRALDLATERYTGGLENFLSVLDAQRSLYSVEDGLAGSETRSIVSVIALYKALGGGWSLTPSAIAGDEAR